MKTARSTRSARVESRSLADTRTAPLEALWIMAGNASSAAIVPSVSSAARYTSQVSLTRLLDNDVHRCLVIINS